MSATTDSIATTPEAACATQLASARPNPVALETMISVTGARQTTAGGSRDLFSEDTTTVLVFRDGAVIRLDAGVAIGQLLFIKHKKSNSEVVCQVLRKRNYKPTSCYVELQFTESKPDFWGVTFPELKTGSPEFKLKEHVEAAETTADDQGGAVAPHTEAEVEKLRKELEALRRQLKTLEQQKAPEAASSASSDFPPPSASPAPPSAVPVPPPSETTQQSASPTPAAAASNVPPFPQTSPPDSAGAPWSQPPKAAPIPVRPIIGMALPIQTKPTEAAAPSSHDAIEALLPKPALDFSKMPEPQTGLQHTPAKSLPRLNTKLLLLVALSLAALVVVGFPWWRHAQFAKSSQPKPAAASTTASRQQPAIPKPPAPAAARPASPAPDTRAATTEKTTSTPTPSESRAVVNNNPTPNSVATANATPHDVRPLRDTSSARRPRSLVKTPPNSDSPSNQNNSESPANSSPASEASAPDSTASNATATPARLLKAASPVYPPDAMRNYITGDVRASILVDHNGRVQNVEVLSGPQALRSAAIDALKRYQYAPATQSGKPVSSTLQVTVKFWFNP